MNRAIANVYAISITHEGGVTQDQKNRIYDLVPALIAEINRMEKLLDDPFIAGYLKAKEQWCKP